METLNYTQLDQDFKEKLQKIKDYLFSLINKRRKKKQNKITDPTTQEIEDILQEDSEPTGTGNSHQEENSFEDMDFKQEKQNTSSGKSKQTDENTSKSEFETPPEDQDEYIPQDSEFGEAMGEQPRFAEIYPPFLGYYAQGKKSYFDRNSNLWSKRKQLRPFTHTLTKGIKRYTYTGVITSGTNAIPLPDGAWPDTTTLHISGKSIPEFQVDQNGCVYLISKEKQFVSFNFGLNQHPNTTAPIPQDKERIIFDSLTGNTQELLNNLKASGGTAQQIAAAIKYYIIKNKKYSTKLQGTLRNKSNRNNYIKNLDESPILECFSANSLFVALCRELGISARLVVGHMVQSVNKDGKASITKNDGHARSEIRDPSIGERIRVDATPTQKEDGENSNENGQEQNNQNNNQNADNNFGDNQNQQTGDQGQQSQQQSSDSQQQSSDSQQQSSDSQQQSSDSQQQSSDSQQQSSDSQQQSSDSQQQSSDSQQQSSDSQQQSLQDSHGDLIKPDSEELQKSPAELLDEMVEKAKEDNLLQQAEQMKDTLDKLENASTKEEIKDILDKSGLSDFAKDMVDKIGKDKILEEEKKEVESLDDEKKIDETLNNSLLDEEYKQKLKEYAKIMKKKIEEEKKKMKNEMDRLGFSQDELQYYKEYKQLEAEVDSEVRKQIRDLQKILPPQYQILRDDRQTYRSGPVLEGSKLAEFVATGDPLIFRRNREVRESNEINMFETIIIDTSGSMGSFTTPGSILRESIKAAITRAKVLEHFKVDFSIVLFGDRVDEVMSFGEKFSSKGKCLIPSKLIRAAHVSGGNSREPISFVYQNMLKQFKQHRGKSFGNVSFIGDGDLYSGSQRPDLKAMIDDLKKRGFGVTAYYINDRRSTLIEYYFGTPQDGGAVYAGDSNELSKKIIESHKTHLKKKINKYTK